MYKKAASAVSYKHRGLQARVIPFRVLKEAECDEVRKINLFCQHEYFICKRCLSLLTTSLIHISIETNTALTFSHRTPFILNNSNRLP